MMKRRMLINQSPSRLVFIPTAAAKTGVYKAPRRRVPTDGDRDAEQIMDVRPPRRSSSLVRLKEHDAGEGEECWERFLCLPSSRKRNTGSLVRTKMGMKRRRSGRSSVLIAAYLKVLPQDREVWIGKWDKAAGYAGEMLGRIRGKVRDRDVVCGVGA